MAILKEEFAYEFLAMQEWVIGATLDESSAEQLVEQVVQAFDYEDREEISKIIQLMEIYRTVKERPETGNATRAYLLYNLLTEGRFVGGIGSLVADAHDDAFPVVGEGCSLTRDVLDAYLEVATFIASETGLCTDPPFADDLATLLVEDFPCDQDSMEAAIYAVVLRAIMVEPWQSLPEENRQTLVTGWTRRLAEIGRPPDKGPSPRGRTRTPEEKVQEDSVESMLHAIVAGPISRQKDRERRIGNNSTKMDPIRDGVGNEDMETCEIVTCYTTNPIPGPYFTLYGTWLSFQAETTGDSRRRVVVAATDSDELTQEELHAHRIDETPDRKKIVEGIVRELEALGWKEYGVGEMWSSHLFRRPR